MAEDKCVSGPGLAVGLLASAAFGALVTYFVSSNTQKTLSSLDTSAPTSAIQQPTTHPMPSYASILTAGMPPDIMSRNIKKL